MQDRKGKHRRNELRVLRLMREGHQCVAYNRYAEAVKALHSQGAVGTATLAPGMGTSPRTPGRHKPDYGLMAAYAVVLNILRTANVGKRSHDSDADYANRLLSAMRKQFGGHDEKKEGR